MRAEVSCRPRHHCRFCTLDDQVTSSEHPPSSDLDGGDPGCCGPSLRPLRANVRGEVSERGEVTFEGPRRAPGLLRLPSRALEAPDDQSDRIDLRHGASENEAHEGRWLSRRFLDDGLQASSSRRAQVAETQRTPASRRRHPRSPIQGRHQGRRLIFAGSHPQLLRISPVPRSPPPHGTASHDQGTHSQSLAPMASIPHRHWLDVVRESTVPVDGAPPIEA